MRTLISALLFLVGLTALGCGANEGVLRSGREPPSPPAADAPTKTTFERDLAEIKEAKFTWLYVVRRRDGGILNSEDKAFVRQHTTDANRRVLSDDGKAVIIGSNYSVTAIGAEALKERFEVTDLSEPPPAQ